MEGRLSFLSIAKCLNVIRILTVLLVGCLNEPKLGSSRSRKSATLLRTNNALIIACFHRATYLSLTFFIFLILRPYLNIFVRSFICARGVICDDDVPSILLPFNPTASRVAQSFSKYLSANNFSVMSTC